MAKTKYEQERDANVKAVQEVFKSFGIAVLAQTVSDVFSKQKGGKGKRLVSDNPKSDTEYDPSSNIDNQSDSDDNSDDDLNNEVNTEVRWITWTINKFLVSPFETYILHCS